MAQHNRPSFLARARVAKDILFGSGSFSELAAKEAGNEPRYFRPRKTKSALADDRFFDFFDSWYFKVLDSSYYRLAAYAVVTYSSICLFFSFLTWPFAENIKLSAADADGSAASAGSSFAVALSWSVTHVITMGYGQFSPYDFDRSEPDLGLLFLATFQQFVGILVNVLAFSVMVTKIQHPSAAIVFARQALVTTRNGQRVLLFRIGNLRCNHIFMPALRLSMLRSESTKEGEHYMKWLPLTVTEIPVVTAVCVAEHIIDGESPLQELSEEWMETLSSSNTDFALSLTFTGRDGVYHDDICAAHRYFRDDIVFGRLRFADTMEVDPRSVKHAEKTGGKPRVFANFDKIGDFVDIGGGEADDEEGDEDAESSSKGSKNLLKDKVEKEFLHLAKFEEGGAAGGTTGAGRSNQIQIASPGAVDVRIRAEGREALAVGDAGSGGAGHEAFFPFHPDEGQESLILPIDDGARGWQTSSENVMPPGGPSPPHGQHLVLPVTRAPEPLRNRHHDQSPEQIIEQDRPTTATAMASNFFSTVCNFKYQYGGSSSSSASGSRDFGPEAGAAGDGASNIKVANNMQLRSRSTGECFVQLEQDFYSLHTTDVGCVPSCFEHPLPNVVYLFCSGDTRGTHNDLEALYAGEDGDVDEDEVQAVEEGGTSSASGTRTGRRADEVEGAAGASGAGGHGRGAGKNEELTLFGGEGLLVKSCSVSSVVDTLLKAARIPHQCVCTDMLEKPSWVVKMGKKATTPAIFYNGTYMEESADILELIVKEFGESHIRKYLAVPDEAEAEKRYTERKKEWLEKNPPAPACSTVEGGAATQTTAEGGEIKASDLPVPNKTEKQEVPAPAEAEAAPAEAEPIKLKPAEAATALHKPTEPVPILVDISTPEAAKRSELLSPSKASEVASPSPSKDPVAAKSPLNAAATSSKVEDSPASCGLQDRPSWKMSASSSSSRKREGDKKSLAPSSPPSKESGTAGGDTGTTGSSSETARKKSDLREGQHSSAPAASTTPAPPSTPVYQDTFQDVYKHLHLHAPRGEVLPKFVMACMMTNVMLAIRTNMVMAQTVQLLEDLSEVDADLDLKLEEMKSRRGGAALASGGGGTVVAGEVAEALAKLRERREEMLTKLTSMDKARKVEIPKLAKNLVDLWACVDEIYKNKASGSGRWLHGDGQRLSLDDCVMLPILNVTAGCMLFMYPMARLGWPPQLPGLDLAREEAAEGELPEKEEGERPLLPPPYYFVHSKLAPEGATSTSGDENNTTRGHDRSWNGRELILPTESASDGTQQPVHLGGAPFACSTAFWTPGTALKLPHIEKALRDFQQTDLYRAVCPGGLPFIWTRKLLEKKSLKMFGFSLPPNETADHLAAVHGDFYLFLQNEIVLPEFVQANRQVAAALDAFEAGHAADVAQEAELQSEAEAAGEGGGAAAFVDRVSASARRQDAAVVSRAKAAGGSISKPAAKRAVKRPPLFLEDPNNPPKANKGSCNTKSGGRFFEDLLKLDPHSYRLIHAEIMRLSMEHNDLFEEFLRDNFAGLTKLRKRAACDKMRAWMRGKLGMTSPRRGGAGAGRSEREEAGSSSAGAGGSEGAQLQAEMHANNASARSSRINSSSGAAGAGPVPFLTPLQRSPAQLQTYQQAQQELQLLHQRQQQQLMFSPVPFAPSEPGELLQRSMMSAASSRPPLPPPTTSQSSYRDNYHNYNYTYNDPHNRARGGNNQLGAHDSQSTLGGSGTPTPQAMLMRERFTTPPLASGGRGVGSRAASNEPSRSAPLPAATSQPPPAAAEEQEGKMSRASSSSKTKTTAKAKPKPTLKRGGSLAGANLCL